MRTAYVAIDIETDDFLKGLNPTTQPGVNIQDDIGDDDIGDDAF